MFFVGLVVLNPLRIVGLMDANWMCSMVYVEYKGTTYPCPVFDWITETKSSFAVGKGTFFIQPNQETMRLHVLTIFQSEGVGLVIAYATAKS